VPAYSHRLPACPPACCPPTVDLPSTLPPHDQQELETFGFRGEALSSLCAVSDLSVVTRTAEQEAGVRLRWVGAFLSG